jgi:hypothetical protein
MKKSPQEQFWMWFKENENMLFNFERHQDRTFSKLRTAMAKVHPNLTFEFGPNKNGTREFIISGGGIKDAIASVESLYATTPKLARWKFIKFRPRREEMVIQINDIKLGFEDIEVAVEADGDKAGFTVFIKGYKESKKDIFLQAAFILLDQAIGEYDMMTKVGFIEFKPYDEGATYKRHNLNHLPQMFDEFMAR